MERLDNNMDSIQITADKTPRYQDAHLELDFSRGLAALDAHRLVLTRKEYELLSLLVENAGEIVPREVLLMRIWGYSNQIRTRTLDVHIRRLRTKLGSYVSNWCPQRSPVDGIPARSYANRQKRE